MSDSFSTPWTVAYQAPLPCGFLGKNTRVAAISFSREGRDLGVAFLPGHHGGVSEIATQGLKMASLTRGCMAREGLSSLKTKVFGPPSWRLRYRGH